MPFFAPRIPDNKLNHEREVLRATQSNSAKEKEMRLFIIYQTYHCNNTSEPSFKIIYFLWSIKHSSEFSNTIQELASNNINTDRPLELLAAIYSMRNTPTFTKIPYIMSCLCTAHKAIQRITDARNAQPNTPLPSSRRTLGNP